MVYNTTGPNDWIANGSNLGGSEEDGYGDTPWERVTNLDFWKKFGKEAIFGRNDPRIQKVGFSGLQTFLIPGGAGVKIFQRGFSLRNTLTSIRSGFLNLGKSFSQYKALYWAGKAKPALTPIINPKTGQVWKQYTELHHRFIPQRWKWAPNWLKNNRFNLKPVSSLQHAQMDPFRARFAPQWVKKMYNLTWK